MSTGTQHALLFVGMWLVKNEGKVCKAVVLDTSVQRVSQQEYDYSNSVTDE